MLHWELRDGLAEEHTGRLAAEMRQARPGRLRKNAGRILVTAGARLEGRAPSPQPTQQARSQPGLLGWPSPPARARRVA
jgi:hypothetical protein